MSSVYHIRRPMILACLNIGDVNFKSLVTVGHFKIVTMKLLLSFFIIKKQYPGRHFETV